MAGVAPAAPGERDDAAIDTGFTARTRDSESEWVGRRGTAA
jgi:hypothetical protein